MDYLVAAAGLCLLVLAGDALVRGAVNLALRLGIPALIVSLTVVAFGTSAPELVIAIDSVLNGAPGLALGNVVGSNIANVLLVLGVPAVLFGMATGDHDTRRSYGFMLAATALFIVLAFMGPLTWLDGLLLLAALTVVLGQQLRAARTHRRARRARDPDEMEIEGVDRSISGWRIALYLVAGLVGLPVGAHLLVDAAVDIATRWSVSQSVIGLTLVAVGTSLPELSTTLIAAWRGKADVALGNVIGSNLFNLLAILGIATLFGPIPVDPEFLRFDIWVMVAASLLLAPFVIRHLNVGRIAGALFAGAYALYLTLLLI